MPKATFMYWQKRLDRENPDKELEEKIVEIRKANKDYGYRRMVGELRNQGYLVNKKKVQRIMQKLELQVTSFTRKSRKYSSYKGKVGTVAPNRINRRFHTHITVSNKHIRAHETRNEVVCHLVLEKKKTKKSNKEAKQSRTQKIGNKVKTLLPPYDTTN